MFKFAVNNRGLIMTNAAIPLGETSLRRKDINNSLKVGVKKKTSRNHFGSPL